MSRKKKKNKKVRELLKFIIITCFVLVILAVLCVVKFKLSNVKKKIVFKTESRNTEIANVKLDADSSFSTIGWLRIQGTNIDYPIIRSDDVDAEFPVQLESYVWSLNLDEHYHNRIRISGHNIFNLSSQPKLSSNYFKRFEELMNFVYYDFAKENQHVQLTIDGKDYVYKIFMVGFVPADEIVWFPVGDDYSPQDMKDYLELFKKYNFYKYDLDVNEYDDVITLNTCTRFYGIGKNVELYVLGRRLRDGEETINYDVSKTDVYNEIETKLKGDENNAEDDM